MIRYYKAKLYLHRFDTGPAQSHPHLLFSIILFYFFTNHFDYVVDLFASKDFEMDIYKRLNFAYRNP